MYALFKNNGAWLCQMFEFSMTMALLYMNQLNEKLLLNAARKWALKKGEVNNRLKKVGTTVCLCNTESHMSLYTWNSTDQYLYLLCVVITHPAAT